MSILIKNGDKYYEIPEEVLARSGLSKEAFEQRLKDMAAAEAERDAPARDQCNFLDLSVCQIDD